jgi:hypothetical protein
MLDIDRDLTKEVTKAKIALQDAVKAWALQLDPENDYSSVTGNPLQGDLQIQRSAKNFPNWARLNY